MFKHLCLKAARFIGLEFQREVKLAVRAMRVTDNLCRSLAYPKFEMFLWYYRGFRAVQHINLEKFYSNIFL